MAAKRDEGPTTLSVTVIGGGITGLSAAHELVERGFDVQVIEKRAHPYEAGQCQIGGMARTQWSRFPAEELNTRPMPRGMRKARPPIGLARALGEVVRDPRVGPEADEGTIPFKLHEDEIDAAAAQRLRSVADRLRAYIETHVARDDDGAPCAPSEVVPEILYVEGYRYVARGAGGMTEEGAYRDEHPNLSANRASAVHAFLARELDAPLPEASWGSLASPAGSSSCRYIDYVDLRRVDMEAVLAATGSYLASEQSVVRLRVAEIALPGEHGYRYFPGFYRHLFDVMKRIPTSEMKPREPEQLQRERVMLAHRRMLKKRLTTGRLSEDIGLIRLTADDAGPEDRWTCVYDGRVVYDNLISAELHSIAREGDDGPAILSRRKPESLKEVLDLIRTLQERMGFEALDLARYQLKLIQYMTSCSERRREYGRMSWSRFVDVDSYSTAFRDAMNIWPQALVGMRADEVDARTAGNITIQILLDQLRDSGLTDATLNGPTSEAWLDPWRRYLEHEGVEFFCAELTHITWNDATGPYFKFDSGRPDIEDTDYYVIALPVEALYGVAKTLQKDLAENHHAAHRTWFAGSDLEKVIRFMEEQHWNANQHESPEPSGPLRHLSGIQFYLEHDVRLVRGHIYYSDSPWGLTSISQVQFRRERPGVRDDYRGIVSVDIGNWTAPGRIGGKPGWSCSPREIGDEVWQQVVAGARVGGWSPSEPVWYHVDDEIRFHLDGDAGGASHDGPRCGVVRNDSPYLLNRPRAWELRPGGSEDDVGRYGLLFCGAPGRTRAAVLAGTFMTTSTRLVTMEAANESARHAVNRILMDAADLGVGGRMGALCEIWPLEDREPEDLRILKDLDEKLRERKLPHLFEILQVEEVLQRCVTEPSFVWGDRWIEQVLESLFGSRTIEMGWLSRVGAGYDIVSALGRVLRQGGWSK